MYTTPLTDDEVRAAAAEISATIQEYLEAIYSMQDEGKTVIGVRLAERMRVAPSTVTATLQRMASAGLIVLSPHKEVLFTRAGLDLARIIIRRHRLTERFLTDILGLEWHEAHEEAVRFEHALSPRMEQRIIKLLNNPTRCPHGNPIPGLARRAPRNRMVLADAAPGDDLQIERISGRGRGGSATAGLLAAQRARTRCPVPCRPRAEVQQYLHRPGRRRTRAGRGR